jgi:hypothetical protein
MHACLRGGWICFNYVVVLVYTNSQISTTRFCERVMTWTSSTRQTMEVIPDGDALAGRICCQSLVLGPSSGPKLHWNSEKRQCFGTKWPPKLNPGSYYYKVRFYKASKRKWHLFCFVLFCSSIYSVCWDSVCLVISGKERHTALYLSEFSTSNLASHEVLNIDKK